MRRLSFALLALTLGGCAERIAYFTPVPATNQVVQCGGNKDPFLLEKRGAIRCGVRLHESKGIFMAHFVMRNTEEAPLQVSNVQLYDGNGAAVPILDPVALANSVISNGSGDAAASLAASQSMALSAQSMPKTYDVSGYGSTLYTGQMAYGSSNYTVSQVPNPGAAFANGMAQGMAIGAIAQEQEARESAQAILGWAYRNIPVEMNRLNEGNFYFQSRGHTIHPMELLVSVQTKSGPEKFSFKSTDAQIAPWPETGSPICDALPRQDSVQSAALETHNQ